MYRPHGRYWYTWGISMYQTLSLCKLSLIIQRLEGTGCYAADCTTDASWVSHSYYTDPSYKECNSPLCERTPGFPLQVS